MKYLLDTDWLVEFLLGHRVAVDLLADRGRHGGAISVITLLEIREGIAMSRHRSRQQQGFSRVLRGPRVLVVGRPVAERCASLRRELRRQQRPIEHRVMDLPIAATAIEHRLTLVARNTRDYADVPDLQIFQQR